jgi:hypothetical protein
MRYTSHIVVGVLSALLAGGVSLFAQEKEPPHPALYALMVKDIRSDLERATQKLAKLEGLLLQTPEAIKELEEGRRGSNEAAAIGALRTLTTAQALFREGDKDNDSVLDYASSLEEIQRAGLIDRVLASGLKQGYRFRIIQGNQFTWSAEAYPDQPGVSGDRSFFVDESGVIRFSTAGPATADSTAIGG